MLVEAMHDAVMLRLDLIINPTHPHRKERLKLEAVRRTLAAQAQIYSKANQLIEGGEGNEWYRFVRIPDEVWDLITDIGFAESWDDVPEHEPFTHGECVICEHIEYAFLS